MMEELPQRPEFRGREIPPKVGKGQFVMEERVGIPREVALADEPLPLACLGDRRKISQAAPSATERCG